MRVAGPEFSPPQVWAVEDRSVQITWGRLPAGPVTARAADRSTTVEHRGGAGALDLDGLVPDTRFDIELIWPGGTTRLTATTLPSPPGQLLTRFATISDMHLGATNWGALRGMTDNSGHPVPHPYRCASAAIAEAIEWGAEFLIIKGDTVEHECSEDFEALGRLVDDHPDLPMLLMPGNHDVDGRPGSIPLSVGRRELPFVRLVEHVDLPGVRIIATDTTVRGKGTGTIDRVAEPVADLIDDADRPVFLALHQQLQATRFPRYWPAGIAAPASTRFLDRLDRHHRPVIVSSGHTHRNRSRIHGSVLHTEVGSTKDWPGVWAGYAAHEGGIRQVVRRIAAPDSIAWTEYSRGAVGGLWGLWSPGSLERRCLTHHWVTSHSYV